jgi:glycosyltransferase involved in cell wall biosynthesis
VDNQTYREAIDDGADGFLAGNEDEWFEKLERLILDKDLRKNIGKEARRKSLQEYTTKNSHNSEYYDYLRKIIDK